MQIEFLVAALRVVAGILAVAVLWPRAWHPSRWSHDRIGGAGARSNLHALRDNDASEQ